MRIIIDAMGGDHAPGEIVRGAVLAAREFGVAVTLVGRCEEIKASISTDDLAGLEVTIEDAREIVTMEDNPSTVVRAKRDSSMAVAMRLLAEGAGDALVSAGSTGALLAYSTFIAKRIHGVRRAALCAALPAEKGYALLLDSGANVECTSELLCQFGMMGSYYAEYVLGINRPRVGLLNVGTEETKGDKLRQETYALLSEMGDRLNFAGNIEAREVLFGAADVIVADGFSGNVMLKMMEGAGLFFSKELKSIFLKSFKSKLAALLVKNEISEFKKKFDYNEVGGAPLLGISKPVIKAHGSSREQTLRSAVRQAMLYTETGVIDKITKAIGETGVKSESDSNDL